MLFNHYKNLIRPEHWEEFQQLLPEQAKGKGDNSSVEKQMSNQAQLEIAANKIIEKYEYGNNDEDDEESF